MPRKSNTPKATDAVDVAAMQRKLAELEDENRKLKSGTGTEDIKLDSYVEVMSLCPYTLTLSTAERGQGRKFSFRTFGETKQIIYHDLIDILEHYRTFMESGRFYIMDERVIRKHGLEDIYENILSKDMMEKIINCDPKYAAKFYQRASEAQREMVETVLFQKIKEGSADLNVVGAISLIAGKDIVKLANESKQLEKLSD